MSSVLLAAQTGPIDSIIHSANNNPFQPSEWSAILPFAHEEQDISASITGNWGTSFDFKITPSLHLLSQLRLNVDLAAVTGTSSTAPVALCDYLLPNMIEKLSLIYEGNIVEEFTGQEMYDMHISGSFDKQRQREAERMGGGLSLSERQFNAAQTSSKYAMFLPFWFSNSCSKVFSPHTLSQDITVRIKLRPLAEVIFAPSASAISCTITSMTLTARGFNIDETEHQRLVGLSLIGKGLFALSVARKTHDVAIANGTSATINLSQTPLNGPINELSLRLFPATDETTTYGRKYTTALPIDTIRIHCNSNVEIDPSQESIELLNDRKLLYYPHAPNNYNYRIPFSLEPTEREHQNGSLNLGGVSNPTITLGWTTAPGYATTLRIIATMPNTVQLSNGKIRRNFN